MLTLQYEGETWPLAFDNTHTFTVVPNDTTVQLDYILSIIAKHMEYNI